MLRPCRGGVSALSGELERPNTAGSCGQTSSRLAFASSIVKDHRRSRHRDLCSWSLGCLSMVSAGASAEADGHECPAVHGVPGKETSTAFSSDGSRVSPLRSLLGVDPFPAVDETDAPHPRAAPIAALRRMPASAAPAARSRKCPHPRSGCDRSLQRFPH